MKITQILQMVSDIKGINVNQSDLSRALGVSRQTINKRIKTDSEITITELGKIEDYFKIALVPDDSHEFDNKTSSTFVNLPVRGDVTASLGSGLIIENEYQTASYQVSPQLLKYLGANKDFTDIIFSQGNSMMPTIQSGDALMIDRSKTEIIDGKIYVVRLDGQLLAKRLQKIPPSTVMVISDNVNNYKPYSIDLTNESIDFDIIGQVLWYSRVAR